MYLTEVCLHWKVLVIASLNISFVLLLPMSLHILKQLREHKHGTFPTVWQENETARILHYRVLNFTGRFGVYCRHCRGYLRLTVTNTLSLVCLV